MTRTSGRRKRKIADETKTMKDRKQEENINGVQNE